MSMRTVSLTKGSDTYLFRYSTGCEDAIVDEFMRLADDDQADMDWLDAATLSFQVARHAATACCRELKPVPD